MRKQAVTPFTEQKRQINLDADAVLHIVRQIPARFQQAQTTAQRKKLVKLLDLLVDYINELEASMDAVMAEEQYWLTVNALMHPSQREQSLEQSLEQRQVLRPTLH